MAKSMCPHCRTMVTIRRTHIGRELRCPLCSAEFTVSLFCPECRQEVRGESCPCGATTLGKSGAAGVPRMKIAQRAKSPPARATLARRPLFIGLGMVVLVAAAMFVGYHAASRGEDRRKTQENMAAIGRAIRSYRAEFSAYPESLQVLLDAGHIQSARTLRDPADGERGGFSYAYVGSVPESTPDFCVIGYSHPGMFPDGRFVLMATGEVRWLAEPDLSANLAASLAQIQSQYAPGTLSEKRRRELVAFFAVPKGT